MSHKKTKEKQTSFKDKKKNKEKQCVFQFLFINQL